MALGPPGQARRMGAGKSLSQRSAAPVLLYFGPGVGPHPAFPSPSKRGVGAPGGAGERAKLPDRLCESRSTPRFRDPSALRGGVEGPAAWGPCEGPGASRRSNAMPVVGHRVLFSFERRDRRRSSKEQNTNYIYSYSKAVNPASDCDFGMRRENAQPAPADCGEPSLKTVTVSGDPHFARAARIGVPVRGCKDDRRAPSRSRARQAASLAPNGTQPDRTCGDLSG